MPNAQVQALAQELVDFISNEPNRFDQEMAAKTRGVHQDMNARKSRLADEVAKKIDAMIAASGADTGADEKAIDYDDRNKGKPGPHRGV